ncbi:MAG TPA: hypothetical protein VJZ27_18615, partial [Aggregatilineales bacterium]|nr:hypothetical protein [Aggregatilineales bacterium]
YGKAWQWSAVFAVLIVLWGFSRPPNFFNALILIPFVAAIAVVWHRLTRPWIVTFIVILVSLAGIYLVRNYLVNKGDVWQNAFMNTLAANILPDAEKREFFAERGMPTDEVAMHFSGYIPANHGGDWNAIFGEWINERGRSVYLEYLLKTPFARAEEALRSPDRVLDPDALLQIYGREHENIGLEQPLPAWESRNIALLYNPGGITFIVIGILTLLLMLSMIAAQHHLDSRWLIPLVVILSTLPIALLNLNADAYEPRHHIANSLKLRLGIVMLALYCFDWMLTYRASYVQRLIAILIVLTGAVEFLSGYRLTRDNLVYPIVSAVSDKNLLKPWELDDLSYQLYQDIERDASIMKIQTDVIDGEVYTRDFIVNWNHHGIYPELMEREGKIGLAWRNTPQPIDVAGPQGAVYGPYYLDEETAAAYRAWRDTRLPGYLLDLGIDYVYVDALSWQHLPLYQRGVLENWYPEVTRIDESMGEGVLLWRIFEQRTWTAQA